MRTSETLKGLSDNLAKALGVITNPSKDAVNPHFKSRYATLDTGLTVVRDALSKHGISFTQTTRMEGDVMMLDTRLMCGNEWIEGEYPVCKFPARQQEIGSSLSYARRYSLFAIVGVAGEDDDDANAATTSTPAPARESLLDALQSEMKQQKTLEDLDAWQSKNMPRISKLGPNDKDALREGYAKRREELNELEEVA